MRLPGLLRILVVLGLLVLAGRPMPASARQGIARDGSLDKPAIQNLYYEGEFERLAKTLEEYRLDHPTLDPEAAVLVYKYLGVIYASDEKTRPKAEKYLRELVRLQPGADLADLYVSPAIQQLFNRIKLEAGAVPPGAGSGAAGGMGGGTGVLGAGGPGSGAGEGGGRGKARKDGEGWFRSWMAWSAAGVALVSAVTVYLLWEGEPEPRVIPAEA